MRFGKSAIRRSCGASRAFGSRRLGSPSLYPHAGGISAVDAIGHTRLGLSQRTPENLGNRKLYLPRGKVIGGSSSINGMVYFRGDELDYDQWAQLGNAGWSYADCLPFFIRSEGHNSSKREGHGTEGPLKTSAPRRPAPFVESLRESRTANGPPMERRLQLR